MTIDEMLDRVAENLGVEAPKPKQAVPAPTPQLSTVSCTAEPKAEDKCHCHESSSEHKCSRSDNAGLDLAYAKKLAQGIEAAADLMGERVVIAIVNEGGNLMCLHAMDNSYIASIKASQEKAFTAVALQMPTHIALKESRGGALDGYTNGNGILMLGGGFPLEKDGHIYGGIGISGGTKEQDTLLAQIGAEVFRRL